MKHWQRKLALPVSIVAIGLGFLISLQLQTQRSVSAVQELQNQRTESIKTVLETATQENTNLKAEHEKLTNELEQARKEGGVPPSILAELTQTNIMNGTQEVNGPGIEITLDDRGQGSQPVYKVSTDDLLNFVNMLRFAGAEAISINKQRIVGSTPIVLSGSNILVDKVPINNTDGVPYVIDAIGKQDTLSDYAKITANELKDEGKNVSVGITRKTVRIPSYKGSYDFNVSQALSK